MEMMLLFSDGGCSILREGLQVFVDIRTEKNIFVTKNMHVLGHKYIYICDKYMYIRDKYILKCICFKCICYKYIYIFVTNIYIFVANTFKNFFFSV